MGDTQRQINQLREQVETLMKERVTPAVTDVAGRADRAVSAAREQAEGRFLAKSRTASARNPRGSGCWLHARAFSEPVSLAAPPPSGRRGVRDGVPSDWVATQVVRQICRSSCGRSDFWPVVM